MKAKELTERTVGDLQQLEDELEGDLLKTRFANFTNQLDDTAKIRRLRREIARVKTILTRRPATAETEEREAMACHQHSEHRRTRPPRVATAARSPAAS